MMPRLLSTVASTPWLANLRLQASLLAPLTASLLASLLACRLRSSIVG